MSKRRRLMPALELPPVLWQAVAAYVGPRKFAKLSPQQQAEIAAALKQCAESIAKRLAADPDDPQRPLA